MIKRLILLFAFLVPLPSHAFVPVLLGLTGAEQVALGASVVFHATVAAVAFKISASDTNPMQTAPLVVHLSPNMPKTSSVPPGWAYCGTTAIDGYPCPPTNNGSPSTVLGWQVGINGLYRSSTPSGACSSIGGIYDSGNVQCKLSQAQCIAAGYTGCPGGGSTVPVGTYSVSTCPAGYYVNGSVCTLTDSKLAQLPADGVKQVPRIGNGITPSTRDTDPLPSGVTQPDANTLDYVDSATGEQVTIHFDSSSGAGTIRHQYTASNRLDTIKETFDISAPDSDGNVTVTGFASQTYQGTGTQISSTPNASGGASSASFPSDYAKSSDISSSATSAHSDANTQADLQRDTNTRLEQLHTDLTATGPSSGDPALPNSDAFESSFFSGTFDGLKAWRFPTHTSTCPSAVMDLTAFFGRVYTLDEHCNLAESNRSTLSAAMIVLWTIVAFFIIMGA